LIDALYSDASRAAIEVEVTYEDGRKGIASAEIEVRSLDAAPSQLKMAS